MFTSILGANNAMLGNIVLAFDVDFGDTNVYSGIYKLLPGAKFDTFMIVNDDYTFVLVSEAIPNPFIETAPVNNDNDEDVTHFAGYRIRIQGIGNLLSKFYNLDRTKSNTMRELVLEQLPGREPFKLGNFTTQRAILRLEVQEEGEFFNINRIIIYGKPVGTGFRQ